MQRLIEKAKNKKDQTYDEEEHELSTDKFKHNF